MDAGTLTQRALEAPDVVSLLQSSAAVDVVAAGKAAAAMVNAFVAGSAVPMRRVLAIGPGRPDILPGGTVWQSAGHPLPDEGSVAGARQALDVARASGADDLLVVLLSGGGSALMALPADGLALAEKQWTARTLMEQGADIYELNTVRKHLSAIKGGQLARAARAQVLTLVLSDVVGDDLSVIASGPTVPDASTFAMALTVLDRRGGRTRYPRAVVERLEAGEAGRLADTPAPGDPELARSRAVIIGPQRGALEGAAAVAESLGYRVHVVPDAVVGEARHAAVAHVDRVKDVLLGTPRPVCVISSGETTVTVTGSGRGGRNQEFAFAMAEPLGALGLDLVAASIGTDGVDGPTDAAGAIVDATTMQRARARGIMDPGDYLANNDTYVFFDRLGDLVRTGPTNTNVGDLQIILRR